MNTDEALSSEILALLKSRPEGKTICPSEATRSVFGHDWREQMEATREVARQLATQGHIEIRQRGRKLTPDHPFRGPIRLALPEEER